MSGTSGAIIWLLIAIIFFIIEGVTVQLVCVWFSLGALVAMIASFFGATPILQLVLFFITSVAVLVFGRPVLKERFMPKKTATNADAIVGQNGVVIEKIDNSLLTGRIHVGGLDWSARSSDGKIIPVEKKVHVLKLDGIKLIVEEIEETEGVKI